MRQLAIEKLNEGDKTLLEGSELTFTLTNTEDAAQVGASLVHTLGTHGAVALIGSRYTLSAAAASVAQSQQIMQLSYSAGSDWLLDQEEDPLFGTVRASSIIAIASVVGCLCLCPLQRQI